VVLVVASGVALEAAVNAVLCQGGKCSRIPCVEKVEMERIAAAGGEVLAGQVAGVWISHLELEHRHGDRVIAGTDATHGYAMWLLWSGVSRYLPSQQLGDRYRTINLLPSGQVGGKSTFSKLCRTSSHGESGFRTAGGVAVWDCPPRSGRPSGKGRTLV
jgi:hypothetical protein